jgi:hypothetical protein
LFVRGRLGLVHGRYPVFTCRFSRRPAGRRLKRKSI